MVPVHGVERLRVDRRLAVAWLAFAAACSTPAPPPPAAAPPAAPAPPANVVVSDPEGAKAHVGQEVDVRGTARDAKLGPVIILASGMPIYCFAMREWPDKVSGKDVLGHGKLELTDEFTAKRPDMAGTGGPIYVLRACQYKPL